MITVIVINNNLKQPASWDHISWTAGHEHSHTVNKFIYRRHKNQLLLPILIHRNPIHCSQCYCTVHFDITVQSRTSPFKKRLKSQVVSLSITLWRPYADSMHSATDCRRPNHSKYSPSPLDPLRFQRNVPLCTRLCAGCTNILNTAVCG